MESSFIFWKVGLLVLALMGTSSATLSPTGINYEGKFSEDFFSDYLYLSFFFLFFSHDYSSFHFSL
jgi:hypothetical protein